MSIRKGYPIGDGTRLERGRASSLAGSTPAPSALEMCSAEPGGDPAADFSAGSGPGGDPTALPPGKVRAGRIRRRAMVFVV